MARHDKNTFHVNRNDDKRPTTDDKVDGFSILIAGFLLVIIVVAVFQDNTAGNLWDQFMYALETW